MKATKKQTELAEVQTRLAWWRRRYGGRGRPIPEELWTAATALADAVGVNATARALGLNRARLARRVSSLFERSGDVGYAKGETVPEQQQNRRNGKTKKTVRTGQGFGRQRRGPRHVAAPHPGDVVR